VRKKKSHFHFGEEIGSEMCEDLDKGRRRRVMWCCVCLVL